MNHLVLHPVEEPAAMLEMVVQVTRPSGAWIPEQFRKACKPGSIKVLCCTPDDVPCVVRARITSKGFILVWCDAPEDNWPTSIAVHISGKARTSPRAWEHHTRQQFTRNRAVFSKALPHE